MPLAAYCFLRAVGKGSYGEVSLVRHRQDSKQYVIKKLNLKHASSRERKAAEQEAQLLSQLKHPNIVAYRESWQGEDGLLYIVMGFCEGGDLYHRLKEQKGKLLPENQVVEWFVQIAMALQYLHEKHILHRDLKTQNVFLTRTNIIKVGDLGIARVLENQCDMASTLIGTPYYMSPELFSNKPYNYKSDVWALGCCVYEMATLKHAFNAKDMNSLVYRIIEGKLPPMPKDYSPQLVEIIQTMLSKKPEQRPTVRSILRQPYIKHQISLFLEATKMKAAKSPKKMADSKLKDASSVVPVKNECHNKDIIPPSSSSERGRKCRVNEEDCAVKYKASKFCPSEKPAVELSTKPRSNDLDNLGGSLATISGVNIDILPYEKRNCGSEKSEHMPEGHKAKCVNASGNSEIISSNPPMKTDGLQKKTKQASKGRSVDSKHSSVDAVEDDDDTLKLLQPALKDQKQTDVDVVYRGASGDAQEKVLSQLQPHGSTHEPSVSRQQWQKKRELAEVCSEKFRAVSPRPLPFATDVCVKAAQSCAEERVANISAPASSAKTSQDAIAKKSRETHCLSDDELSSSTSSTDKSDGDFKEKKSSVSEVNELVQLMICTLRVDPKDSSECSVTSTPAPEFKLHRKYRDTLSLHGKSSEPSEDFEFEEIPSDMLSGPEKMRRMVEVLRSDVVRGLGVKLLERVYSIMEEEDEVKRELQLREHMGAKYVSYSAKARHLKFLEENGEF
ncbi:serine/threonine-protein kinase Nek4 isoform X3 [Centrocercus urophasianus]|uniref:serine/threonine-protein kinase Nek4 isoform X3 n=1 Tax=Centrocercus urophasianus TaxID=9002 RepID=UPI001C64FC07|nr:serine/threonine-protein kinase Nek4 isoform X3 [Centrocercus urophasianus]